MNNKIYSFILLISVVLAISCETNDSFIEHENDFENSLIN